MEDSSSLSLSLTHSGPTSSNDGGGGGVRTVAVEEEAAESHLQL